VVSLVERAKKTKSRRLVEKMPRREDLAAYLRKCLGYASVTRAELFADNDVQRPISFHDLRATGITWMAMRGDDALAIQQRAGHTTFGTTQGYVRLAGTLGTVGAVFPPVPRFVTGSVTGDATKLEALTIPAEKRRPQRDLKASACHEQSRIGANCSEPAASCEQFETRGRRFVTGYVTEIGALERWELAMLETEQ
jgi:hypothetical protein